jgi:hypothetical protein
MYDLYLARHPEAFVELLAIAPEVTYTKNFRILIAICMFCERQALANAKNRVYFDISFNRCVRVRYSIAVKLS